MFWFYAKNVSSLSVIGQDQTQEYSPREEVIQLDRQILNEIGSVVHEKSKDAPIRKKDNENPKDIHSSRR